MADFCINCGTQLPKGVAFCPNCGAPVSSKPEQPTAAPGNMTAAAPGSVPASGPAPVGRGPAADPAKKKYFLFAGIAAAILLAAVIAMGSIASKPDVMIERSLLNTGKAMSQQGIGNLLGSAMQHGSIELNADIPSMGYYSSGSTGSFDIKLVSDAENSAGMVQVKGQVLESGEDSAALYYSPKELVLDCGSALPDVYGVDLVNLKSNLAKSILAPDSGSRYALDEDSYNAILSSLESTSKASTLPAEAGALGEKYGALFVKTMCEEGEVSKNSDSVDVGSSSIRANVVTVTLDAPALAAVMSDLNDEAQRDADLHSFFTKIAEEAHMAEGGNESVSEMVDSLFQEMDDGVSELQSESKGSDSQLTVRFYIGKSSGRLVKFSLKVKESEVNAAEATLTLGDEPGVRDDITLEYNDSVSSDGSVIYAYKIKQNTSSKYEAEFSGSIEGEMFTADIDWDKSDGNFVINMNDGGSGSDDSVTLNGTLKWENDKAEFNFTNATSGDESIDINVGFTVNGSESLPKTPKYTDLTSLDESDMEDIANTAQSAFQSFSSLSDLFDF